MSSNIETSFTVDWLSITFNKYGAKKFGKKIGYMGWASHVDGHPARAYNRCHELETGVRISWHTENEGQGYHFVFTGQALRWYAAKSYDWHELMFDAHAAGGRCSRIDLAFDIRNGGLVLANFAKTERSPYKGKGRTPNILPVGTQEDGWTVYVGARQSQKFLRIYDKAKERKDFSSDYIRVELECKEETAHALGWNFGQIPLSECVNMARGLVLGHVDFKSAGWRAGMHGEITQFSLPQGKDKDTFGWLLKSVVPALAKEIAKHPTESILDQFWDALRDRLREQGIEPYLDSDA